MHFDYLEEHEMLRDAARGFLERHDPVALLRAEPPLARQPRCDGWLAGAGQGWTGMLVDEAHGGTGLTIVEAMVVAEELGRAGHSAAFASLNAAAAAIGLQGSQDQRRAILPGIASGETRVIAVPGGSVQAEATAEGWRIEGAARLVADADIADLFVVDVSTLVGPSQLIVPSGVAGLGLREVIAIDVSRRYCDLTFQNVVVPASALLGPDGGAGEAITRQRQVAAILTAADSVGLASRLLDMTVAYTKERIAFGKPIAAFQAVKHRCADMLIQIENARVATWYAAVALRDGRDDLAEAASIAKFFATEAGAFVASNALQLHGGIGMTWEHDLHFFYKRAKANEILWGSNASHRETVADALAI